MSCSLSLATLAELFFSPRKKFRNPIVRLPSLRPEDALEPARLHRLGEAHRLVFAKKTRHHVLVGLGHIGAREMDGRRALVGRLQHALALGDDADQRRAQDLVDVVQAQHLAAFDAVGVVARDEQMLLDGLGTFDGALGLAAEHAEDAVAVAYRRDLGVGHHQRLVGVVHRHQRAGLDAGRRIADDVVKLHLLQLVQHALDAFLLQRVLVAGLRGRQDVELVELLVLDEGLRQLDLVVNDIDQVVHHAALDAHDQVEVAQAHVEVDDAGLVAAHREAGGKTRAGGGLADPALAGGDDDDLGHLDASLRFDQIRCSGAAAAAFRLATALAPAGPPPRVAAGSRRYGRCPRWRAARPPGSACRCVPWCHRARRRSPCHAAAHKCGCCRRQ
mmetsp:Transcript_59446/g.140617  ORF Transcript_59446/g.140617 Transcript_59446/m.140617 type:complete len:388 (-) Transcript_59446:74-1237(-)